MQCDPLNLAYVVCGRANAELSGNTVPEPERMRRRGSAWRKGEPLAQGFIRIRTIIADLLFLLHFPW
jgi:hypothetical protein